MRIPIDKIVVNKEVIVRGEVDPQFVEELANSMRIIGQINPILHILPRAEDGQFAEGYREV